MDAPEIKPIDVGPEKKSPQSGELTQDARTWGMSAHMSGLIAVLLSGGVAPFLGPLVVYFLKKDEHPFVEDQAKEALNFQLTMFIAVIIAGAITGATCGFGFPLLFVPIVLQIIFGIIGSMKANNGEYYRYPICIRMIT